MLLFVHQYSDNRNFPCYPCTYILIDWLFCDLLRCYFCDVRCVLESGELTALKDLFDAKGSEVSSQLKKLIGQVGHVVICHAVYHS